MQRSHGRLSLHRVLLFRHSKHARATDPRLRFRSCGPNAAAITFAYDAILGDPRCSGRSTTQILGAKKLFRQKLSKKKHPLVK